MQKPLQTVVSAAILALLASSSAQAGGFSLYTESSAYALGNFTAGVAAEAADASTGWYNPAGLSLIREQQAVFSGAGVFPSSTITGTSTFAAFPEPYVQSYTDMDGGENAFVPAFHYALPFGENTTLGFSVVSPFGLATNWDVLSPVRYAATFTELITANFSPEIGSRLTQNFAIGGGLDLQYAKVKFNRMIGLPTIFGNLPPFNPYAVDSLSYNKGDSFGVGFHAGVMGLFNDEHTRIGLNYQSKMRHTFHGYSQLLGSLANTGNIFAPVETLPGNALTRSEALTSNSIQLPDILSLGAYHDINDRLAILGSVVYTGWNVFQVIQLNNVAAPSVNPLTGDLAQVRVNSSSQQNYDDAWRLAIGANYQVNEQFMLRVGGGYDQTPTNDIDRDIRLPDVDRWALSIGAHYQARYNLGVDVGYTHLFAANTSPINKTEALGTTSSYSVNAIADAHADLVGAQVVWTMDQPMPMPTK